MKKITYITLLLFGTFLFVQCTEDDSDRVIDPPATCNDGIQNGNETGIDCGGPDCPPCEDGEGIDFSGIYVQEDQVGRPAVARLFVTLALRDDYNTTIPSQMQALFQADMQANLLALNPDYETNGGNGFGQDAETFTTMISRDVLWVAQTGSATFYDGIRTLTGRKLGDDVMDLYLRLIFGGPDFENPLNDGTDGQPLLISDGVDANDKPFLSSFPYLAPPF